MKKISFALFVLLMLAGCSQQQAPQTSATSSAPNQMMETMTGPVTFEEISVTPVDVLDLFTKEQPDAFIYAIKLETSRRHGHVYELDGIDEKAKREHEWTVHPGTAEILSQSSSRSDDREKALTKEQLARIPELVQSALADVGESATLEEWQASYELRRPILEMEINRKGGGDVEKYFNLDTGELIKKDW